MLRKTLPFAAFFALIFAIYALSIATEQYILSQKLVRLHVIANSDAPDDQSLKLMVRDAVLAANDAAPLDLAVLEKAANDTVAEHGYDYSVSVELGREHYPTRRYDGFSLPAGDYNSLRVTLGDGDGQNWWCVLFPPLCMTAAESFEVVAYDAGFTEDELALITDEDSFEVRFRLLEILRDLSNFFAGDK